MLLTMSSVLSMSRYLRRMVKKSWRVWEYVLFTVLIRMRDSFEMTALTRVCTAQ
jgi:hypothetical protein